MKKCASCTKDLPDAALHCVFCGAKQPPAPAVQQGMAKTAFGYSANDVVDQVRQQAAQQGRPLPPTAQAPAYNPPPFTPARPGPGPMAQPMAPPMAPMAQPPRPAPMMAPPPPNAPPYPGAGAPGAFVPASPANAATMFAPGPPQAQQPTMQPPPNYGRPNPPAAMLPTLVAGQPPPQLQPQPPLQPLQPLLQPQAPKPHAPIMPIPAAQPPPYHTSQTASRSIRPLEPWKDSLRLMMFVWGVALLAAFATPLQTSPDLLFNWKLILDGEGTARLPPLMLAAIGLLSVIVAAIPMQPAPRGLIAALLGLAGIAVPIALVGVPPWQALVAVIGMLLLVPSLLVRNEYRGSLVARLLVTLGAIGVLLPSLLPQGGAIPLVNIVKTLIDVPGSAKIGPGLELGLITVVVISLLAWLPAPVTGAAKLWAWFLILWALIVHAALIVTGDNLVDTLTHTPNAAIVSWIAAGVPIGSAYLVLVGYGLASVLGKQLE